MDFYIYNLAGSCVWQWLAFKLDVLSIKQKQTHRRKEQTCGCQGEGGGRGMAWELGVSRFRLLCLEGMLGVGDEQMQTIIHRIDKQQSPKV